LRHLLLRRFAHVELTRLRGERALAPYPVDRAIACRRHEPRARAGRQPLSRPSLGSDRKGLLRGFLGEVEVAEEADQRREDAAPLLAKDLLDARGLGGDR
jgi:hypothetical protein